MKVNFAFQVAERSPLLDGRGGQEEGEGRPLRRRQLVPEDAVQARRLRHDVQRTHRPPGEEAKAQLEDIPKKLVHSISMGTHQLVRSETHQL